MDCPNCGKESISTDPTEIMICECGYNFKEKVVEKPQKPEAIQPPQRVIITDVQMSLGAMIRFMVMWAIASIPAAIIIGIIYLVIFLILSGSS